MYPSTCMAYSRSQQCSVKCFSKKNTCEYRVVHHDKLPTAGCSLKCLEFFTVNDLQFLHRLISRRRLDGDVLILYTNSSYLKQILGVFYTDCEEAFLLLFRHSEKQYNTGLRARTAAELPRCKSWLCHFLTTQL